jgi:hypothetical protein
MRDIAWYAPRKHGLTDPVTGVDATLLADLHDCIEAFGRPVGADGAVRRIGFDGEDKVPLYATATAARLGEIRIAIGRDPHSIAVEGVRTIVLSAPLPSGVTIEHGITAEDIRGLIDHIDAPMKEAGMFGSRGERRRIHYEVPEPAYDVATMFARPGSVYRIPHGQSYEDALKALGNREELVPILIIGKNDEDSYGGLVHRDDPELASYVRAAEYVAKAWGLQRPNEIARFDAEMVSRFFAEVYVAAKRLEP